MLASGERNPSSMVTHRSTCGRRTRSAPTRHGVRSRWSSWKRGGHEKLRTFVNTVLGETWKDRGDAPEWERLYQRRELYPIGSVPPGPIVLTAGVDVQKDRLVFEVVGWAATKESWSIDAGEFFGDTSLPSTWAKLDELLGRTFGVGDGLEMSIAMLAVDSGYNTQEVYGWARKHPMSRVIACKGSSTARMLIGAPSVVDVTIRGKKMSRGYKVWPIGVDIAKGEFYGWLGLPSSAAAESMPGYCHFPEHGESYFQQITAEHLMTTVSRRTGRARLEWQVLPNRENHYLDCRILARAAAAVLGIDRMKTPRPATGAAPTPTPVAPPTAPSPRTDANMPASASPRSFLKRPPRGSWFQRRR
jgi:phage terminase large subunit GpA-like protein